jgi:hypothetical protein
MKACSAKALVPWTCASSEARRIKKRRSAPGQGAQEATRAPRACARDRWTPASPLPSRSSVPTVQAPCMIPTGAVRIAAASTASNGDRAPSVARLRQTAEAGGAAGERSPAQNSGDAQEACAVAQVVECGRNVPTATSRAFWWCDRGFTNRYSIVRGTFAPQAAELISTSRLLLLQPSTDSQRWRAAWRTADRRGRRDYRTSVTLLERLAFRKGSQRAELGLSCRSPVRGLGRGLGRSHTWT